jgi:hypothetical protein
VDAHRSRVEEVAATPDGLWRLAKWVRERGTMQSFTSLLQKPDGTLEHSHKAKARMLKDAFFLLPSEVDLSDIEDYSYPDPIMLPDIMPAEVDRYG